MQVIALTEELLATAKQNEISGSEIVTSVSESPGLSPPNGNKQVIGIPMWFCFIWNAENLLYVLVRYNSYYDGVLIELSFRT